MREAELSTSFSNQNGGGVGLVRNTAPPHIRLYLRFAVALSKLIHGISNKRRQMQWKIFNEVMFYHMSCRIAT